MSVPAITVLMPVHNGRRFLHEAVSSILTQSFRDFEFLIIDDASSDGASDDLALLRDPRIRLYRNAENLGITRTLNLGLNFARGEHIARMDGDDVAEPNRLLTQFEFLKANPHIGIVGSARTIIDESGRVIAVGTVPKTDTEIRWKCLLGNPFAHPTVMMRRGILEQHHLRYDPAYPAAEDYEMWTRLLAVTQGANLAEPLLRYRIRAGISQTNKPAQLATHDRIAFQAVRNLLPEFQISESEISELRGRFGGFSVREESMDPVDKKWRAVYAAMREAFDGRYQSLASS